MDTLIKIGLVLLAVGMILALLSPLITQLVDGFSDFATNFTPILNTLVPYLEFGRALLNYLFGSSTAATIILWFVLLSPFFEHTALLLNRIYKRLTS